MKPAIPGSDAIFRVLFSLIFIGAGIRHLVRPDALAARLADAPLSHLATAVAPAALLIVLAGLVLLPAGIALATGLYTRVAALALIAVVIPITITTHLGNPAAVGPLFKNLALIGGLIHFASKGAGEYSLDRRREAMTATGVSMALVGGALIGTAASLLLAWNGRIAGISGILAGIFQRDTSELSWQLAFLFGMVGGGGALLFAYPVAFPAAIPGAFTQLALAGLLVGYGSRLGNGCTSGHGVCGISRFSPRSIVATVTFMTTGALTVYLVRHVWGG